MVSLSYRVIMPEEVSVTYGNVVHDSLEAKIKKLLSDRFTSVEILSVEIADKLDEDDGGVEITVTFRGTPDQLASGRPAGMFEIVRAKLGEISKSAFPVFNFISLDARA